MRRNVSSVASADLGLTLEDTELPAWVRNKHEYRSQRLDLVGDTRHRPGGTAKPLW